MQPCLCSLHLRELNDNLVHMLHCLDAEQELRYLLNDVMPLHAHVNVQEYECILHTAFSGDMFWHGRCCTLADVHVVRLREDHFIQGTAETHAIQIHCQRVLQSLLRLHHKSPHLVASLHLGDQRWTVAELLFDQRLVHGELVRAVKSGREVHVVMFVLATRERGKEKIKEQRYIEVRKAFHLCFKTSSDATDGKSRSRCWPPRVTQLFESIFLSKAHMLACIDAEGIRGNPIESWRCMKWKQELEARAAAAANSGDLIVACSTISMLEFLEGQSSRHAPGAFRLLQSGASKLRSLSNLCRVIYGVIGTIAIDDNNTKCKQVVLTSMFEAYKAATLEYLSSDACCNLEVVRLPVQAAFMQVSAELKDKGVLDTYAHQPLELTDDYLQAVQASIAYQVVQNLPAMDAALKRVSMSTGSK